jgi:hypothetical protein
MHLISQWYLAHGKRSNGATSVKPSCSETQQDTSTGEHQAKQAHQRQLACGGRKLGGWLRWRVGLGRRAILREELWWGWEDLRGLNFLTRGLLRFYRCSLQGHNRRVVGRFRRDLCGRFQIRRHRRHGLVGDPGESHRAHLRIYELLTVGVNLIPIFVRNLGDVSIGRRIQQLEPVCACRQHLAWNLDGPAERHFCEPVPGICVRPWRQGRSQTIRQTTTAIVVTLFVVRLFIFSSF